ncbi:hypothetical protein HYS00_02975 [Candidatus Microgenomates bacterium]|nr:hypothetical protein [Candidatus Microgenomates bacterium]
MRRLVLSIAVVVLMTCVISLSLHLKLNTPQKALTPPILSQHAYAKMKVKLFTLVDQQNPRIAIEWLKKQMETDPNARGFCHELLHETGRHAYGKYHDFTKALSYRDEVCVAGYIHGVIEAYFKSSADLFTSIKMVCADHPGGKYITWECYHGVGHGLMYYTDNNVPASLDYCESYDTPFARSACANGVFMENASADHDNHPSKFLKSEDAFYPCDVFPYKSDCYMNAPVRFLATHNNDYRRAFTWCHDAHEYESDCIYGVASQMTRRNMGHEEEMQTMCASLTSPKNGTCIKSMVVWYITYYGRLNEARSLCDRLHQSNKPLCKKVVAAYVPQL